MTASRSSWNLKASVAPFFRTPGASFMIPDGFLNLYPIVLGSPIDPVSLAGSIDPRLLYFLMKQGFERDSRITFS